jgi:amino acid adenylation domain-containing protein
MTAVNTTRLAEARRTLLEQRLRGTGTAAAARPVTPRTGSGPAPLSVSQRQLWYTSQLAPESVAYNELVTFRKTGPLDTEALRSALTEVVRRHQAWRTRFPLIDGEPRQVVDEPPDFDLPLLDLSHLPFAEAESHATALAAADTRQPYDLATGPLIRPRLVRMAADQHRLYLGLHHLIFDGVTLYRIVLPELVALYDAYASGLPSPLPGPELQYPDYADWERDWADGPIAAARIARWRSRLADATPVQLPLDHPRPPRQRYLGGIVPLRIERATVERLRAIGRRSGGTLFHAVAAAYAWWLHSYTGTTDIVFGTASDLRQRPELSALVGYCLTPVVIRGDVSGEPTFAELVDRQRGAVLDSLGDVVPFESLIRNLGISRDPRSNPLFQTMLVLEPPMIAPDAHWSVHQMESAVGDTVGAAKFDLTIELDERPEGHIDGRFIFNADLFDRATAREMARHWIRLLDTAAGDPNRPMPELDLLDPAQRHRQLTDWNPPAVEPVSRRCVHELITEQAERTPDTVAVQIGESRLTYRQLDDRAEDVATRLIAAGAGTGTVVAAFLERSPDLVAGLLGILKSGAAYLPLDPRHPHERSAFMLDDAGARVLLTDTRPPASLTDTVETVISLDGTRRPQNPPRPAPSRPASPADLAYIIYTSGSTGRPKGVLVEHRNVMNLMATLFPRFGVTDTDTVLSVASYTFDMAVGDIFCTLGTGARLVLATAEQATNPAALSSLIASSGATYLMATPTTFSALLTAGWPGGDRLIAVPAGEPLTDALADTLLGRCRAVWNAWGPTEATVITGAARLTKGDTVTVGTPLPGVAVYVIDQRGRLLPPGVPGEIAVGGAGVARGYLNRPEENARRFLADPYATGGRMYRTGDRGRFLPDGRLQHLGRYDDQVKIRGFRIEPGEVEAVLCEHPDVAAGAVLAREAPTGDRQLVAYLVGEAGRPTDADVRTWLRARLPEYMVPAAFVHLPSLPTTASGKLDRTALPGPESPHGPADQRPRNADEERVAALWTELLGVDVADVHTDFFDLGGHSLLAARLIAEIDRKFGVPLPLLDFLEQGTTVARLAALLTRPRTPTSVSPSGQPPPVYFIYPDIPCAMSLRHIAAEWGDEQPVHPLIPAQPGGRFDLSQGVEQLAEPLLATIRQQHPHGPYTLAGFSLGGLLAYEIARRLTESGEQVDWLGVLDTPAPPTAQILKARLTPWARFHRLRTLPVGQRWAKYVEVALRTLRHGPNAPSPQERYDFRGAVEIACGYTRPGHRVPMTLFVTDDSAAEVDAALLGWDHFHQGTLEVRPLPGSHVTLLDQPQVGEVAQIVLSALQDARCSTPQSSTTGTSVAEQEL